MKKLHQKRYRGFAATLVACVLCWTGHGLAEFPPTVSFQSAQQLCIPLGEDFIDPPQSIDAKRKPVKFPHSEHFLYKCKRCHHSWDGQSSVIQGCKTKGCHDQFSAPKISLKNGKKTPAAKRYFKYAYHDLCRGCHMALKRENEHMKKASMEERKNHPFLTGPTGCVECHPR